MIKSVLHRLILLAAVILFATACGISRRIPQGEYLLQQAKVETDNSLPKKERISSTVLDSYIRQTPNKKILGLNFYVWIYNSANPNSDNWWNRLLRKIGEEPVIYDQALAKKSVQNLEIFMQSQGYYSSSANFEVDTTRRKKRAYLKFNVEQGKPYIINSLDYKYKDKTLEPIITPDTAKCLVKVGDIFNASTLDKERERIATDLRTKGYYNFTVNNIEYLADTLSGDRTVALTMVIKRHLAGYDKQGNASYSPNTKFRINKINVIPDFDPSIVMNDTTYLSRVDTLNYDDLSIIYDGEQTNLKPFVLRASIPLKTGELYNIHTVENTYKNLMSMGYFKSARVSFNEQKTENTLSNSEGLLNCNILCTPSLRQSFNVELEGSTTSSFYGLSATLGYQNRNIFRGAELFDASITIGNEFIKNSDANSSRNNSYEYGFMTSLTFPRFIVPFFSGYAPNLVSPKTILELSMNYQDRAYYQRTLSSISWGYSWRSKGYSSFNIAPININVINRGYMNPTFEASLVNLYLKESYQPQITAGLLFGYSYNNQPRNLNGNATMFRFNFESSGNAIDGLSRMFQEDQASGYYELLGIRYAQYVRGDINLSHKIVLGDRTSIAGRIFGGVGVTYGNSESLTLPVDRLFYVGGSNSMRGWSPRTLGPGSSPLPEQILYPSQLGDMRLEANLEFRFPIWSMFHGALFFDAGNVWFIRESGDNSDPQSLFNINNFHEQLGFNTGLGLRIDIQFVVLRLDWGVQLHNPNMPAGERWIKPLQLDHTALNFGVGYPF